MRSDAKNLQRISEAIDIHDRGCGQPAVQIRMSPFEIERLGWDEVRGVPIVADDTLPTGRFRIVCERELPSLATEVADRKVAA